MAELDYWSGYQRQAAAAVLLGHELTLERLDSERGDLAVRVFGGNGWSAPPGASADPRASQAVDLFLAMAILDPEEPAFAWNRAGLLCDLGRFAEGAHGFLEAASGLESRISKGLTDSEEAEWGEAARAYAARALLRAGCLVAAAAMCHDIEDAENREDVREEIEQALREGGDSLDPIEWIPRPRWRRQ
jgi:hypothetical protein